jgi:DNA polymerase-1
MKTIPATIWDGQDLVTYTEAEADYWHLYQTLTGDATDGYKGCPGMGPKKAASLLDKALSTADGTALKPCVGVWWPAVAQAYAKQGLTEEHALTQARLARILRWTDWDANKKEPKLWAPST